MLVSHSKRFIYLKTMKTAGTSIEIFFERFCRPPGAGAESHRVAQIVGPEGIVGHRGPEHRDSGGATRYFNHMAAEAVRAAVGTGTWDSYFKFCAIRNPYDKMVSYWWFVLAPEERLRMAAASFGEVRGAFGDFVRATSADALDRHVYLIGTRVAVDYFIRYECLQADLEEVCRLLGVDRCRSELGRYKSEMRLRPEHYSDYYDADAEDRIAGVYAWEMSRFGYRLRA